MAGDAIVEPARSIYQLRVVHPRTGERITDFIVDAIASLFLGEGHQFVKDVTLEIVDLRRNQVVIERHETQESARVLAGTIANDLDRLDAPTFAAEWGIGQGA
jgi:hypothetical protein